MSSDAAAATELLRRREIRRSLAQWARFVGFEPAAHHLLLIEKLERVAHGELKRLAVFMPPGSAKSTYSSILFPPWFLANAPGKSLIAASHSVDLAEKFGRRVRGLIAEHGPVLGVELSPDSQAAGRWALSSGSEYLAAGVGTGILGFRADGVVIDDPVRSREEAWSERARESTWEWYRADLLTRLRPGGFVVLVMTRWHDDDLAARALQEEKWEVVSLPAEAEPGDLLGREPGEMLWDTEYGYAKFLRQQKLVQPAYNWSALFLQRPAPESGEFFKAEWLREYRAGELPDIGTLACYVGVDFAVSAGKGDFTAIVVVGVDPTGDLWLIDMWRKQADSAESVDALLDLVQRWKPIVVATESGQIKSALGPWLRKRMDERRIYVATEVFPTKGDKSARAASIRGTMAVRGLRVPRDAPWYYDFRSELLAFPVGRHDDAVDATALVGQCIDRMHAGSPLSPQKKPPRILSTDPATNTICMNDLWEAEERRHKRACSRIN